MSTTEQKLATLREYIDDPGNWSALDGRRSTLLGILNAEADHNAFHAAVHAERARQVEKGYDQPHDDKHGTDHLLMWAQECARRGETVKAAALIEAAREKLARDAGKESA